MSDQKIPMLEPYTVKATVSAMSESTDYNHTMLNIPAMWAKTKGKGVKVAVLDTGAPDHIDVRVAGMANFTEEADSIDRAGHGSHVAGIICATEGNGIGVKGIAPEAELYCGKVLESSGSGTMDGIVKGIYWAVDEVGADVINMSLGCSPVFGLHPGLKKAVAYAHSKNVVVCAAAGNDAGSVNYPAALPTAIAVAAVDKDKSKAYFTCHGTEVDFAAGGVDVFSTYLNNQYALLSGTSMATPVITGVAALIIAEAKKYMSPSDITTEFVYDKLVGIAVDVEQEGKDDYTGYGIPVFTSQVEITPENGKNTENKAKIAKKSLFSRIFDWILGFFR